MSNVSRTAASFSLSTLENIARACHEVNQMFCREVGDAPSPDWMYLTAAQREGVVTGVRLALSGATNEASHESWLASRVAEGWTYGLVKDFAKKTSPNMVPYAELPKVQRLKDTLFQDTARLLARIFLAAGQS
jgi:hypothetical protein